MANNTINSRIVLCTATTDQWASSTKVLLKGEVAIEITSAEPKIKIGDGVSTFASLSYTTMTPTEIASAIASSVAESGHTHTNKTILDAIEVALTSALKTNYDAAYAHSQASHAPTDAQANVIEVVQLNGTALTITNKTVNVSLTKSDVGLGNVDNTSDANKPVSTATQTALDNKVDKVDGKGLSANDYTTAEKTKLAGLANSATANTITMNGATNASPSFYAPTTAGTSGQALVSAGSGAPTWQTLDTGVTSVNGSTGAVTLNADGIDDTSTTNKFATSAQLTQIETNKTDISSLGTSKMDASLKGAANGVAELDSSGLVPASQLPSYLDDVEEYAAQANFPSTGETGKIYVDDTTNLQYRWSGTQYIGLNPSLALGETSATAYRGDRGKIAYDHSQTAHARSDATAAAASTTNGNIKINGTETAVYAHPASGVTAGTYRSVTVDAQGHVSAGTNPTTLSGYGVTSVSTDLLDDGANTLVIVGGGAS